MFSVLHVTLMAYVNVVSLVCYCGCFLLINKGMMRAYIYVTYVEIIAHALLALFSIGGGSGFQLYFIGNVSIIFFTQYFFVHLGTEPINGMKLSLVCGIFYVLTLFIDQIHTPLYTLSETAIFWISIINSVLMLGFNISTFGLLTTVASNFEIELANQASHDSLTGLVNRHYLMTYMHDVYQTDKMESHWLAILDIDDFKKSMISMDISAAITCCAPWLKFSKSAAANTSYADGAVKSS